MIGCTFKRTLPSGRITWGYSIDAGKDEHGKRKQIFKSGFERKKDADDALRQKLNEKDQGELVAPDPTTFAAFLQEWFREHAERNCTPKTVERLPRTRGIRAAPHWRYQVAGSLRARTGTCL
jgi:hypothetical protein